MSLRYIQHNKMSPHYQLTDAEFLRQFTNLRLQPTWFTHEAHLRLAWINLQQQPVDTAASMLCDQIRAFDQKFGEGKQYNKTVTVAATKVMHHFIAKGKATQFPELLEEFPRLKTHFKDLLFCHYSFDIFKNGEAKHKYLEPDLLPF